MQFWWTVDDKNEIMLSRSSDSNYKKKLSKWSISCMITRAAFSQVTFNDCPQLFFLHLVAFSMGQHWLNNMATKWVGKDCWIICYSMRSTKISGLSVQHKKATPFQHPKFVNSTQKEPQFNTPLSSITLQFNQFLTSTHFFVQNRLEDRIHNIIDLN